MAYKHIAFLSYKFNDHSDYWHVQTKDLLVDYLRKKLGLPDANLFFVKSSNVPTGTVDDMLSDAAQASKVVIAFFSPSYFRSKWCIAEFRTFLEREDALQLQPGTLAFAFRLTPVYGIPEWARNLHHTDLSKYFVLHKQFWSSDHGAKLKEELQRHASHIAQKIMDAPEYHPGFPKFDVSHADPSLDPTPKRHFPPIRGLIDRSK